MNVSRDTPLTPLPRTRRGMTDERMRELLPRIDELVPQAELTELIASAAAELRAVCAGKRVLVGWSGGKDSLAMEPVLTWADIDWVGVQGIPHHSLEARPFLDWCEQFRPPQVRLYERREYDLHWLAGPGNGYLFPPNARVGYFWTKTFTHWSQEQAWADMMADILVVGRRHADGNYIGENGIHTNNKGITAYCPIRDWSHEQTIAAAMLGTGKPLPPTYSWPNGFSVGTGPWAGWQGQADRAAGFRRLGQISPMQLIDVARVLPEAEPYVREVGGTR